MATIVVVVQIRQFESASFEARFARSPQQNSEAAARAVTCTAAQEKCVDDFACTVRRVSNNADILTTFWARVKYNLYAYS